MKIPRRFKVILLSSLALLYLTGLVTWVLSHWFQVNSGFGLEPSSLRQWWLQVHSIVGLWFMVVFGYLFHSHVQPAWRRGQKRKSGLALTSLLIVLILTVPALFYVANDGLKSSVAQFHTYAGLSLLLLVIAHLKSR